VEKMQDQPIPKIISEYNPVDKNDLGGPKKKYDQFLM
jgi:hypothetical protein